MPLVDPLSIKSVLVSHARRYPLLREQDLYKLLVQAALGNEHASADAEQARKWFDREIREMGEGPLEPLFEAIDLEGKILRVHLRPLARSAFDPAMVLDAFLASGKSFQGSTERLENYLQTALSVSSQNTFSFSEKQLEEYLDLMRSQGFPAVHHSKEYRSAYRPAYRVVARAALPDMFMKI